MNKNTSKIKTTVILLCVSTLILGTNKVKAETLDDVRESLGKQRYDTLYTDKEIQKLTKDYLAYEENNDLYSLYSKKDIQEKNKKAQKKKESVELELIKDQTVFNNAIQTNYNTLRVIKNYTKYKTTKTKYKKVQEIQDLNDIKYKSNRYAKQYKKMRSIVKELKGYKSIGSIGSNATTPLNDGYNLVSPYGILTKNKKKSELVKHKGADFEAEKNQRNGVKATYNGVVEKIANEGTVTVVLKVHSKMRVLYTSNNLKLDVREGEKVKQGDTIGKLSKGVLHYEVHFDSKAVNPIYLHGSLSKDSTLALATRSKDKRVQSMIPSILSIKVKDKYKPNKNTNESYLNGVQTDENKSQQDKHKGETIKSTLKGESPNPNSSKIDTMPNDKTNGDD